jgi:hypothetical protein
MMTTYEVRRFLSIEVSTDAFPDSCEIVCLLSTGRGPTPSVPFGERDRASADRVALALLKPAASEVLRVREENDRRTYRVPGRGEPDGWFEVPRG